MRILYGVPSEGMGHATRSKVIINYLLRSGHEVRIATSDRAFELLERAFPGRCYRIEGLHLRYDRGTVDRFATFRHLMASGPEGLKTNLEQLLRLQRDELPELVISDFESFTFYAAKLNRLPLLSIDNMQVINRCELGFTIPDSERDSHRLAKTIIKAKVPFCQRYLITSFFDAPIRKKRTQLIPPILREEILTARARQLVGAVPQGGHVLVYQTATSEAELVSSLQSVSRERFIVYGYNRQEDHDNVQLRSFSEAGFIEDLASCKAVITNGGFSLISEALYLQRPICSFPLAGQFEQFVNGAQVETLGYGRRFDSFSADSVRAFLYDLQGLTANVARYEQDGNQRTFQALEQFLTDLQQGQLDREPEELPEAGATQ
jgi:uncharacterized protein (TIGR00661 family)